MYEKKRTSQNEIEQKRKAQQVRKIIVILLIFLLCTGYFCMKKILRGSEIIVEIGEEKEKTDTDGNSTPSEDFGESGEPKEQLIFVDVSGAVVSPSVIALPEGARIYQAIEKAGGTSSAAETKYLNLAAIVRDGEKIYVPTKEELSISGTDYKNLASIIPGLSSSENSKININTANSEELQKLNGIGPSTAEKIIDYRNENGNFQSIEEICNVSGIGEKTLEKFKQNICV